MTRTEDLYESARITELHNSTKIVTVLAKDMMQLIELVRLQHEALKESIDLVQQDYHDDWRHGIPTRSAQLAGKLELLTAHKEAIDAFNKFEGGE